MRLELHPLRFLAPTAYRKKLTQPSYAFNFEPTLLDDACHDANFSLNDLSSLNFNYNSPEQGNYFYANTTVQSGPHQVDVLIKGTCDSSGPLRQIIYFHIHRVNGQLVSGPVGFTVVVWPQAAPIVYELTAAPFVQEVHIPITNSAGPPVASTSAVPVSSVSTSISIPSAASVSSIPSTELQAHNTSVLPDSQSLDSDEDRILSDFRAQLRYQTKLIRIKTGPCVKPLHEELEACDGLTCSLKTVCRHFGALLKHCFTEIGRRSDEFDYAMEERFRQSVVASEKEGLLENHFSPSNGTCKAKTIVLVDPPNELVRLLEVIAGVLGLAGLLALIRRRFSSLRRRVERLADREERRTAREYKRAARQLKWANRREAVRQRWQSVRGALCRKAYRNCDYEEKRALIIEAAQAAMVEEGDRAGPSVLSIEEEIEGLRYAHEIVSSLVQAEHGQSSTPYSSPLGSDAPTPTPASGLYTAVHDTRSRSSSLPSYNSETLPDYSSQLESDGEERVSDGFRPGARLVRARRGRIHTVNRQRHNCLLWSVTCYTGQQHP
ncbi:hypothetical protein H2203_001976 [Taxawa tesnikishii (nom. ined.)]|nr:hypothetical protein H2203_001976 [Dothideales sp. JES 119]